MLYNYIRGEDSIAAFEQTDDQGSKIFLLNDGNIKEIEEYTEDVKDNIPEYISNIGTDLILPQIFQGRIINRRILFAQGGHSEELNMDYPDTWIYIGIINPAISIDDNYDTIAIYLQIYADDIQYTCPLSGEYHFIGKSRKRIDS